MKIKIISIVVSSSIFFVLTFNFVSAGSSNLANVAILQMTDKTNSDAFTWVKKSLPETISDSMRLNFSFSKISKSEIRKTQKKYKNYNSKNLPLVARALNADYVIYGDYTFEKKKEQLNISISIYTRNKKKIQTLPTIHNKVDKTLFFAINKASNQLNRAILEIAKEKNKDVKLRTSAQRTNVVFIPAIKDEASSDNAKISVGLVGLKVYLRLKFDAEYFTFNEFVSLKNDDTKVDNLQNLSELKSWILKYPNSKVVFVDYKASKAVFTTLQKKALDSSIILSIKASPSTRVNRWIEVGNKLLLPARLKYALLKNKRSGGLFCN